MSVLPKKRFFCCLIVVFYSIQGHVYGKPLKKHPTRKKLEIQSFSLISIGTNKPIVDPIESGEVISSQQLPLKEVAIQANTAGDKGVMVRFRLRKNRGSYARSDHSSPYVLKAEQNKVLFDKGIYRLRATPYVMKKGKRSRVGKSLKVVFSIDTATSEPADPGEDKKPGPAAPTIPIPELALWESQMIDYGQLHCERLADPSIDFDTKLLSTYYDGQWVYYQIADYTEDSSWNNCAQTAEAIYRNQYVAPNNGVIPGYWNFSHGLTEDYLRTGDSASKIAGLLLSQQASYAADWTPLSWTADSTLSREVAYAIMSYLNAEMAGAPHRARTEDLVAQALGHLDQWCVSQTAPYVRPFMVALTAQALISYNEVTPNADILPALRKAADWLWAHTWLPASKAFMYTDRVVESGGQEPAADLNLLIAPLYAWIYHQTGDDVYRDRADQIFSGGVQQAYLLNGKQFDQSYRWTFDFVKWRSIAPLG